jgi:integrase
MKIINRGSDTAPLLALPKWEDAAEPYPTLPYPLSWEEQRRFFKLLPDYLHKMALFKVNTGLRAQGVCWLRWDWEFEIPELNTSIFITPGKPVQYADGLWPGEKNKEDQVVVLNRVARSVIEGQRGLHPDYVFAYRDKRIYQMNNSGWQTAWEKSGLPIDGSYTKGPHNLKHTFGRRLRAAGVAYETRKVLLHHKSGDVTTHYSPAELEELINAVEKIVEKESGKNPAFTLIRRNVVNG